METDEDLKGKTGNNRKVLRKCAAVAANKIKLMSDVEEDSSSESLCSGRKLPHRNASAAARRKLLHNSDNLKSETEELNNQNRSPLLSGPHSAQDSVSDSDSDLRVARKNWHANGCTSHTSAACKTKSLPVESSEEDSRGHESDDGRSSTAAPSTSGQKLETENISEEVDSEPGSSKLRKNTHLFKKATILSDSEDCEEQGRESNGSHTVEGDPVPETLRSGAVSVPQGLSGPGSETEVDSDVGTAKDKLHSDMNGNSKHSPVH